MYVSLEIYTKLCILYCSRDSGYIYLSLVKNLAHSETERKASEKCRSIHTVIPAKLFLGFKVVELPQKPDVDREEEVAAVIGVAVDVIDHCRAKKTLNNVWSITNNSCRYRSLYLKLSFRICFYYFTVDTLSFLIL